MCGICAILTISPEFVVGQGDMPPSGKCLTAQARVELGFDEESLLSSRLKHRGPDIQRVLSHQLSPSVHLTVCGCMLHFRGAPTPQPLEDAAGNTLLWNGEVFGGIDVSGKNDGMTLLEFLGNCTCALEIISVFSQIRGPWAMIYYQAQTDTLWFGRDVFGRRSLLVHVDADGRCLALSSVQLMHLKPWVELPARGLYSLPCSSTISSVITERFILYPWVSGTSGDSPNVVCNPSVKAEETLVIRDCAKLSVTHGEYGIVSTIALFNRDPEPPVSTITPFDRGSELPPCAAHSVDGDTPKGGRSSENIEKPQCSMSACSVDGVDSEGATQSGDVTGQKGYKTLKDSARKKTDHPDQSPPSPIDILTAATPEHLRLAEQLISVLGEAVRVRVQEQAPLCDRCIKERMQTYSTTRKPRKRTVPPNGIPKDGVPDDPLVGLSELRLHAGDEDGTFADLEGSESDIRCGHARTAVLFSGGIDSLVLTALADRFVPTGEPIDLLNVAFEQKTTPVVGKKKGHQQNNSPLDGTQPTRDAYDVPDRVTGRGGVRLLNPVRPWNFIEVNVTADELQRARVDHVQDLIYPLQTVLDDSIGCAIWFAARGQGECMALSDDRSDCDNQPGDCSTDQPTDHPGADRSAKHGSVNCLAKSPMRTAYISTARVVLVGMGADEQLAGYSRHRVKYNAAGLPGLVGEIQMEIDRISARNLGRDDRIITDHGKESRFPFLDENVVSFLNALPIWNKADLSLPRGIGEKLLLRVAAVQLGLGTAATLPKRAIQFGSRIAKMENRKEKASDMCSRLHEV